MALSVHHAALAPRAQWPEGGGRAGQVQADVPEGVDGGGDPTRSKQGVQVSTTARGQRSDKAPQRLAGSTGAAEAALTGTLGR